MATDKNEINLKKTELKLNERYLLTKYNKISTLVRL